MHALDPTGPELRDTIDWRERDSVVLSDLYDGDRRLILANAIGPTRQRLSAMHAEVRVPHPLSGVAYADGTQPGKSPWEPRTKGPSA